MTRGERLGHNGMPVPLGSWRPSPLCDWLDSLMGLPGSSPCLIGSAPSSPSWLWVPLRGG